MEKANYQNRASQIINEMLGDIESEALTNYSKTHFKQAELAKTLGIARQTLNKAISENDYREWSILKLLLENLSDDKDVIKCLIMKYQLDEMFDMIVTSKDEKYREAALEGLSYLSHWQLSNKYNLDKKTCIYEYISNFYLKKNPLHYFFYDLFKRYKRILITTSFEPNGKHINNFYMMFLNDRERTLELHNYIDSLNIRFPLSFDDYMKILINVKDKFSAQYIHYPDLVNEINYIIENLDDKKILENNKLDFFDLRRLFKTSMSEKCFLNDVLDFYHIDSKYVYNSCRIKALKIEELINLVTMYNFTMSKENERVLYHSGSDDFKLSKPYQSAIVINRNKQLPIKRINLHMHSTCSDGKYTVKELYEKMMENNLDIMSLTDHDTIDGVFEMKQLCENDNKVKFITGCEFSVYLEEINANSIFTNDITLHVLCYGYDLEKMQAKLNEFADEKRLDYQKYSNKLEKKFNIKIPECPNDKYQKVTIVNYLVENGIVDSVDAGYQILSELGWKTKKLTMEKLSSIVKETGGLLIWAHPFDILYGCSKITINNFDVKKITKILKGYGLNGIEAHYSNFSLNKQKFLTSLAKEENLMTSYGTDFHREKPNQAYYIEASEKDIDERFLK